jgi:hypothetical protein
MFVPKISNCDGMNLQNVSVTLTFEEGTWFLNVIQRSDVVDICTKLL